MTDNKIGTEGARALSEGLKVNKTLTWLNLGCKEERKRKDKEEKEKENKNRQ